MLLKGVVINNLIERSPDGINFEALFCLCNVPVLSTAKTFLSYISQTVSSFC